MKSWSIRLRLTLWYLVVFATAQFGFGLGMWSILRHNLYEIADDQLVNQIDDLRHFLEAQKKNASTAKLQEEVTESYALEHSGDYLQIFVPPEDWIYRAPFMEEMSSPLQAHDPYTTNSSWQPIYKDRYLGGKLFRFLAQEIVVHDRHFFVQTGIPIEDIARTLARFRRYLLMLAPVIFLAASAVGYWLSARALSPVDDLTRTARSISGTNLSLRLEALHTGDELQRLSETLNEMFDRIESAFLRITQFTADASHELRTPVSLIRAEAEIALRRSRTEEEYRNTLSHILTEAEETTALLEKLLSLARADSGRETLDFQELDLRELAPKLEDEWRVIAGSRALEFTQSIAPGELPVEADKPALQQLLNILLDNAVKYTPAHGKITLSMESTADKVVIKVIDSGIGISGGDQKRIFERFYRVDKARSRSLGGAGLGLAIGLWIVQQHRGTIAVESEPGKGSAFVVEIPRLPTASFRELTRSL